MAPGLHTAGPYDQDALRQKQRRSMHAAARKARPGPGTLTGVDPKAETGVTLALQSRKNWNRILGSGSVRASMNEAPDYRCLGRAGVGSLCSDREQQHFNRNLEDLKPRLD
jgi:hypothetical protein